MHKPTILQLEESAITEIRHVKSQLRNFFAKDNRDVIFFEVKLPTKGTYHTHVQCIPLPKAVLQKAVQTLQQEFEKLGLKFEKTKSATDVSKLVQNATENSEDINYVIIEWADERLFAQVNNEQRIPVQLPR
jgi:hypothetical protein